MKVESLRNFADGRDEKGALRSYAKGKSYTIKDEKAKVFIACGWMKKG